MIDSRWQRQRWLWNSNDDTRRIDGRVADGGWVSDRDGRYDQSPGFYLALKVTVTIIFFYFQFLKKLNKHKQSGGLIQYQLFTENMLYAWA